MGEVYLAWDAQLDRAVALKILPPDVAADGERMRRFVQEAKTSAALNHPSVAHIYEIGEYEGANFIAMEFVEGETLRERTGRTPLGLVAALEVAAQTAAALAAAHEAGIVHRDVKPENVMLRRDRLVKVLDFGLAKLTTTPNRQAFADSQAPTRAQFKTAPGVIMGTVAYMSPEQARGLETDARTDLWSLGVLLYEMLTRRRPFAGETQSDVLAAILTSEPPPPRDFDPEIPAELERIVLKALRKDLAERYQSAAVLLSDLRRLQRRLELAAELGRAAGGVKSAEAETQIIGAVTGESLKATGKTVARWVIERHTVGREAERKELRAGFESASGGRGLLLCVAGEPGIGKTTLVEDFLSELTAERCCTIARGRCSERLAGTEAYLPLLEALESLIESGSDREAARALKQLAPTWYAQLVPLAGETAEAARLLNEVRSASQERMKRELGVFLQEVSRLRPLVLFFDDLHWADVSTVDVLSFLAARFDALNVLVVVTYRPSELLLAKHPFLQIKPDLQARGFCRELTLGFLKQAEVAEYLALEFPGHHFPPEFPKLIHAKTEGSPLFMADLVRYLRDRDVIARADGGWALAQALPDIERELPESVRGMIERKIAQLGEEERRLLVAASVQGYEFESAVVARVLKVGADEVEERLEKLERVYAFVRLVDEREYPDRGLTLRYRFVHVLYQNALYAGLRPTRRVSLSREVARALEGFHGDERTGVASELAALWEAAREYARAADYFRLAAGQAGQVMAAQEAAALARRGLRMVEMLPESRERRERELSLLVVLGNALFATRGYAAPEVEETFTRAYELGRQLDDPQHLLPLLWGLYAVSFCRPRYPKALAYGEEFLRLAERVQGPALVGHTMVGTSLFWMGELEQALDYLRRSASLYAPEQHRPLTWVYGHEPGMYAEVYLSDTLWLLGYPDQALAHAAEVLRLGLAVAQAQSQAFALMSAALINQWRGDLQRMGELTEEGFALCAEQGLPLWLAYATTKRGWLKAERGEAAEGIAEMRRGIAGVRSTGAEIVLTVDLCMLAEQYGKAGRHGEGLAVVAEALALAEKGGERCWEAELYRVKGELLRGAGAEASEAEASFRQAVEIARRQKAKSLELRAAVSLARLWQQQGKRAEAHKILADIYGWFTEGFETLDLKEAGGLLEELQRPAL
jgi:predicted ATPase